MRIGFRSLVLVAIVATSLMATAAEPNFRDWVNSPEAYFATSAELAAYEKIGNQADAEKFVEQFWQRRGSEFRKAVRTRIEKADELFGLGKTPGSRTPKGRVFIMLGSPNREHTERGTMAQGVLPGTGQTNSVEVGNLVVSKWVYQKDRLPKDLGVPELTVNFQTDTARSNQTIENPGLIEPYLKRVAEYYAGRPAVAAAPSAVTPAKPAVAAEDPLWAAAENLAGAFFDADAYIAPNEKPFYAVNFYLPKSVPAFANVESALLVGLVKDASGKQVAAIREQVKVKPYGTSGDRYVDHSFALDPGRYSGMFALFTPEGTTLLSNRKIDFTVASPKDTTVTQLLPTSQIDVFDKQFPLDPFTFIATKYAVKSDRTFSAKDKLAFFAVIANPAGDPEPSVAMTMKILSDGKVLFRTPAETAALTQTGPHTWMVGPAFDPGTFKPGQYTIEIQLKDLKAPKEADGSIKTYSVRSDFRVE
jgi:GWxTD domain-containing protein